MGNFPKDKQQKLYNCFEIISKPNNWARAVKSSVVNGEVSDTKLTQLEYWDAFKNYARQHNTTLRFQKSYPQHWTNISIGSSECNISLTINTRDNAIACELYISNNKELYQQLYARKAEIEQSLNENLEWMELPDRKASRIKISFSGDVLNRSDWDRQFEWMKEKAESFKKVFPVFLNA